VAQIKRSGKTLPFMRLGKGTPRPCEGKKAELTHPALEFFVESVLEVAFRLVFLWSGVYGFGKEELWVQDVRLPWRQL